MFTTGFQSCSAMAANMKCAIGVLTADPEFAEDLRKEVDGQASRICKIRRISMICMICRICSISIFEFFSCRLYVRFFCLYV